MFPRSVMWNFDQRYHKIELRGKMTLHNQSNIEMVCGGR